MTGLIAQRLFWKEYRVQRGLWVSLAIGTVALQLLIRVLADDPGQIAEAFYWTAASLTFCFAVGSAAISFATDREDGTHLRMLTLAPSPFLTFSVKLLFVVFATVLLCVVTWASAWFVARTGLRMPPPSDEPRLEFVAQFAVWLATGIAWGMLFSLLFRHVFTALLSGAIASIIMMGVLSTVWHEHGYRDHLASNELPAHEFWEFAGINALALIGLVALTGINGLLTRRWCRRSFLDDDAPSRIRLWFGQTPVRRTSAQSGLTLELGVHSDLTVPVLTAEEAVMQPAPRLSLGWLYHPWGSRSRRPFRFLRWKELAETRPGFLFACGVIALVSALSATNMPAAPPFSFLMLFVLPPLAGMLTFRSEQRRDHFHFLADNGLSPRTVWLSKQSVWLPRLTGVMLLIVTLVFAVSQSGPVVVSMFRNVFCMGFTELEIQRRLAPQATIWLGENPVVRGIMIPLTMYCIGQAASLTCRRAVVGTFVTILGVMTTMIWVGFCTAGGIPILLSTLPMAPALLLFTYLRTGPWLLNRNTTRSWLPAVTVLVCSVMLCLVMTATYRVMEIPSVRAGGETSGLSFQQQAELRAAWTPDEQETGELYRLATSRIRRVAFSEASILRGDRAIETEKLRAIVATHAESIEMVREAARREACAFKRPDQLSFIVPDIGNCQKLMLAAGLVETADGQLDEALQSFHAAFAVSRHMAGRGDVRSTWLNARRYTLDVLSALAIWAAHPEVNTRRIANATKLINDSMAALPGMLVVNYGEHWRLRSVVAAGPDAIRDHAQNERFPVNDPALQWIYRFPGVSWRMHRIVDWSDAVSSADIAGFESDEGGKFTGGKGSAYRLLVSSDRQLASQLNRWMTTTPSLRRLRARHTVSYATEEMSLRTQAAATLLMIHLLHAERRDGTLPDSLDDMPEELADPWTGKPFAWYPEGIPQTLKSTVVYIPPNHPFLLSGGVSRARIERIEFTVVKDLDMEYGMGGSGGSPMAPAGQPDPVAAGGVGLGAAPAAVDQPDEGAASEPAAEMIVEYVIRHGLPEHTNSPTVFLLPRQPVAAAAE